MEPPVVQLSRVSRRFGQITAAADVTFGVQRGEVFGLLGHNGAGKTTVIRLVNGLLVPDAGTVRAFGLDPLGEGREVRSRTGVLTTYPGLDEYLSPAENLSVYAAIHGMAPDVTADRVSGLLTRLGLAPHARQPSRGLSAGLKQRVALARALVHDPELLLLDEPTANLDPIASRDVRSLVRDLASEGRTVMLSTHNLAEAEELCDRVAVLQKGHLLAVGSLSELAAGRLHVGIEISVGASQGPRAKEVLAPSLNGRRVDAPPGDVISIRDATPEEVPPWVRALVEAGLDVQGVVPRRPSLEDVYLAIHQSGART